ncbi:MAG: endonuclease/exonuclease/phosphatase family protein [Myxococcota bacterium]|nr:endonuclease/exonuclease/phosphatase family protein [Myxococcota bacterium]
MGRGLTSQVTYLLLLGLLMGCGQTDDPAMSIYQQDMALRTGDFGPASPDAAPPTPGETVTVATFNVRKFFDTNCDSRNCGDSSFERMPSESEFRAKAQQIANGIRFLGGDVLLLQEIETQICLNTLMEFLAEDGYTISVLGETGGSASLDVAVVARGDLVGRRSHKDEQIPLPNSGSTTFSRDFLEVHLEIKGKRVVVLNAHFKAKTRDDPQRRLAEAMAARVIALDLANEQPDALVVLGGDLNDTPGSNPIQALEGSNGMVRVAAELGEGAATYTYQGVPQAIDHLYLVETPAGRYRSGTARVVRSNQRGLAGSDHAGLIATFEVTGAR